jgi:hypothetical protein
MSHFAITEAWKELGIEDKSNYLAITAALRRRRCPDPRRAPPNDHEEFPSEHPKGQTLVPAAEPFARCHAAHEGAALSALLTEDDPPKRDMIGHN